MCVCVCVCMCVCVCTCVNIIKLPRTVQECVVYLCGTKVDLVEENKKARKVDVHVVRDYAEGMLRVAVGD